MPQGVSTIMSTTLRTPGVRQAELVAVSRSAQLCTVPDSVTSVPCTVTAICWASASAARFSAASMSGVASSLWHVRERGQVAGNAKLK